MVAATAGEKPPAFGAKMENDLTGFFASMKMSKLLISKN